VAGLVLVSPAGAWSPETQRAIAREAARLAPPTIAAALRSEAGALAAGAVEPFRERDPARHVKNPGTGGRHDVVILVEAEAAAAALAAARPWSEIARRLGRVSHFVADANFPLNASAADPAERRYFADFARYAESARGRFVLVAYGTDRGPGSRSAAARMIDQALARSRQLYPSIGREYRRVGWVSGAGRFDDRSTAFAVAALGYSHAVSDAARLFRWVAEKGGRRPLEIRIASVGSGATGASD
jgi:hypothetical protein